MSSVFESEDSVLLSVGNPFFNYQRVVSKFFVPTYVKDFFGYGRRKVIRTFASVCYQERLTVQQVYTAYVRLFYQAAERFSVPRRLINSHYRLILNSFDISTIITTSLIESKFDMMKSHVHRLIQEVRDQENEFNNQISSLQQQVLDNQQAQKEFEINVIHLRHLQEENEKLKSVNLELQNNSESYKLQHQQKDEVINVLRSTISDKEEEIKNCYANFSTLQNEFENIKAEQLVFETDLQKEKDVIIHLKCQRDDITNQVSSLKQENSNLNKQRIDLNKRNNLQNNTINQLKNTNEKLKKEVSQFQNNSRNRQSSLGYASLDPHDLDNIAKEFNKLLVSEEISSYSLFLKKLQVNQQLLKVLNLSKKGKSSIFFKGKKRFREYLQPSLNGCSIYDLLVNTHQFICSQVDSDGDMDVSNESYY